MNIELRKDCPMRHENGNCQPAGGFCTAVNDQICEALRNAYNSGWNDGALTTQRQAERNEPLTLDELRHGEPVYVVVPGKPHRSKWCIVDLYSPQPGLRGIEYFCNFSIVATNAVQVYRNKPKEGCR